MRYLPRVVLLSVLAACGDDDASERVDADGRRADASMPTRDSGFDSGATDASVRDGGPSVDAATRCVLEGGRCPKGCFALDAIPYDRRRGCVVADERIVVGCMPFPGLSDPRCLMNIKSQTVYRVPLSLEEGYMALGLAGDWTTCSRTDDDTVSSTLTPSCSLVDDDGGR